ncbi:hypothetical protein TURU_121114 [Turdus rufiventris]|nr:hypothetical protein TURU_121114 [Turdus rufiventris]
MYNLRKENPTGIAMGMVQAGAELDVTPQPSQRAAEVPNAPPGRGKSSRNCHGNDPQERAELDVTPRLHKELLKCPMYDLKKENPTGIAMRMVPRQDLTPQISQKAVEVPSAPPEKGKSNRNCHGNGPQAGAELDVTPQTSWRAVEVPNVPPEKGKSHRNCHGNVPRAAAQLGVTPQTSQRVSEVPNVQPEKGKSNRNCHGNGPQAGFDPSDFTKGC